MRWDLGNIQRSTANLATSSASQQRREIGPTLPVLEDRQCIVSKLAQEYLALNTVAEHVLFESEGFKGNAHGPHAPIGSFAELMLVRIGVTDLADIIAKVVKKAVGYVEVGPSRRCSRSERNTRHRLISGDCRRTNGPWTKRS